MSHDVSNDALNDSISVLRRTSSFKDYLKGLDLIRQSITDREHELKRAMMEFYKVSDADENLYNQYLQSISKSFDSTFEVTNFSLIINSEKVLLHLINNFAKSLNKTDRNDCLLIIETLTDFHENLKYTQEVLQIIVDNFEKEVLDRLKKLSLNDFFDFESSNQSIDYRTKVKDYCAEVTRIIHQFRLLIISCKSNMSIDLLTKTPLVDRLTIDCDVKRFPLLIIIPDLNSKLENVFRVGKMWLDREEVFLYQIREEIRELKVLTKQKCLKIEDEKQNHSRLIKEMKNSNLMVQNNKHKMTEIKIQLKELNEQILSSKSEYERKNSQKTHSKSMVEFLEISISQTKKNYNLQLKRQKLQREINELENSLVAIQDQIAQIKSKIDVISETAEFVEMKSKNDEKDFLKIKDDLEKYSQNVFILKRDLNNLKKLLNAFQSIEILRTSPEYVENIFDQPTSEFVKLAPSLMKKIDMKKQLLP